MITELWESDPFTQRRQSMISKIDSDYHWSNGDVFVDKRGGDFAKFRVLSVRVEIRDDGLQREILALRID